jgi:hypothetical protein
MTPAEGFSVSSDEELYVFDAKARSCPECRSPWLPKTGCEHPWHQFAKATEGVLDDDHTHADEHTPGYCEESPGCVLPFGHDRNLPEADRGPENHRLAGHCHDGQECRNHCSTMACSRRCRVCLRMEDATEMHGEPVVPCPACPDARRARAGRCPDGGYCHGSNLEVGSGVCKPGRCFRVTTGGPLSNVFPGNKWPAKVVARNSESEASPRPEEAPLPDGKPLIESIIKASDLKSALQGALGSREGRDDIAVRLRLAVQLAQQITGLIVQAHRNLTGEETIKYQGVTYTAPPPD